MHCDVPFSLLVLASGVIYSARALGKTSVVHVPSGLLVCRHARVSCQVDVLVGLCLREPFNGCCLDTQTLGGRRVAECAKTIWAEPIANGREDRR